MILVHCPKTETVTDGPDATVGHKTPKILVNHVASAPDVTGLVFMQIIRSQYLWDSVEKIFP